MGTAAPPVLDLDRAPTLDRRLPRDARPADKTDRGERDRTRRPGGGDGGRGGVLPALMFVLVVFGLAGALIWFETFGANRIVLVDGQPRIADQYRAEFDQRLPGFLDVNAEIYGDETKAEIARIVDAKLDAAFNPVLAQVPAYADFHYSMIGQVTELSAALGRDSGAVLKEQLFDKADFETNLAAAQDGIRSDAGGVLAAAGEKLAEQARQDFGFTSEDVGHVGQVVAFTLDDAERRFEAYMPLRAGAALVGVTFFTQSGRRVMNAFLRRLGQRAAARVAAGRVASATGGAAACSFFGPIGALVCGVGAVIVTEAVILELDELINREDFEAQIADMVGEMKSEYRAQLVAQYAEAIDQIREQNARGFESLRVIDVPAGD